MTSPRVIHPGSSSGSSSGVQVAEDVSDLDRKSLEEMMTTLPDMAWVLKIVGHGRFAGLTRPVNQFFGGVCIGSEGLILTTSQGMIPGLEAVKLNHNWVSGRPRNNTSFKRLKLFWEDSNSELKVFRVENDTKRESYCHVDVSDVAAVDSDLIGICVMGDQPFSRFLGYTPGPAADFDGTKYLSVYGKSFVEASDIFYDCIMHTTMAGSPLFNSKSGKLVGIISRYYERYCLAIQLDKRVIEQLKKLFEERVEGIEVK